MFPSYFSQLPDGRTGVMVPAEFDDQAVVDQAHIALELMRRLGLPWLMVVNRDV